MGYAGGTVQDPTYHDLDGHSETIQIDFDPAQISYEELLNVFWESHSPTARPWSRQYASIIFYHNEEQHRLAIETKERESTSQGMDIFTEIVPFTHFYLAEGYHQKYRLQQIPALAEAFRGIYADDLDFVNSTAAARANGLAAGYGTLESMQAEIDALNLSPEAEQTLLDIVSRFNLESEGPP